MTWFLNWKHGDILGKVVKNETKHFFWKLALNCRENEKNPKKRRLEGNSSEILVENGTKLFKFT